jgi:hypothetical protein
MGALSSANLLKNDIGIDHAQALVAILKEHPTLESLCGNKGDETELDMSGKMRGAADAIMLVPEIIDNNGAPSKLIFGGDGGTCNYSTNWENVPFEPATLVVGMTEAEFSNKNLGAGDAIIIGAWLTHRDNGAMMSLNLSGNQLRTASASQPSGLGQKRYPSPIRTRMAVCTSKYLINMPHTSVRRISGR